MARPTNPELCAAFRALLTGKATDAFDVIEHELEQTWHIGEGQIDLIGRTKSWRGELWKAFAEIEERLDPIGVETRRREKANAPQN